MPTITKEAETARINLKIIETHIITVKTWMLSLPSILKHWKNSRKKSLIPKAYSFNGK